MSAGSASPQRPKEPRTIYLFWALSLLDLHLSLLPMRYPCGRAAPFGHFLFIIPFVIWFHGFSRLYTRAANFILYLVSIVLFLPISTLLSTAALAFLSSHQAFLVCDRIWLFLSFFGLRSGRLLSLIILQTVFVEIWCIAAISCTVSLSAT